MGIAKTNIGIGGKPKVLITIESPTVASALLFEYDGNEKSIVVVGFDSETMVQTGDASGTNAGDYSINFQPKDGYCWNDGTTDLKTYSWTINKAVISTIPSQSGTITYNDDSQEPSWNNYNSSQLTISGETSGTDANFYTAIFTPTENYKWNDNSESKTAIWQIQKAVVSTVPSQSGTLIYNGSSQNVSWTGYDSAKMDISGDISGTNAGDYSATFTLKNNYKWDDDSASKTVTWKINKIDVAVPSQNGTITYDGSSKEPLWNVYTGSSDTIMTIGGTTSGTTAGSYTATFTLNNTTNYQWADETITDKSVTWTISKAKGTLSLNKNTVTVSTDAPTATVTVTRSGNGAISAVSSNTEVATVSINGDTITITGVGSGTANVTVSVAESDNYLAPTNMSIIVTADMVKVYGVSWDGSSTTTWLRTDDATDFTNPVPYMSTISNYSSPFDTCMPWSGMQKSERTGGTMVSIPKFWYKITQNGNGMKIQIADNAKSGFTVSPAHMNRGDGKGERDVVYVGRYHCSTDNYKSKTGLKPKASITRSAARTAIHNLGTNIWQSDFAMRFTLWLLYIVEYADWNTQAKIGKGCGNNSSTENMGFTDSMPYHTGTTLSSRSANGIGTQYRYIEGLWDNVYDWCDGCYYNSNGLNIILNPANFSDSSGGVLVGKPSNDYPSKFSVVAPNGIYQLFYPTEARGSSTTYSCDDWCFNASSPCLYVGGDYNQVYSRGMFCVYCNGTSNSDGGIGSRLQELP